MDYSTARKKAEQALQNHVTDVRIGEMDLAAWSHASVGSTQMLRYTREEFGGVAHELGCDPEDQDILFVGFDSPNSADYMTACIYPKDDFVALEIEGTIGDERYGPEPVCAMTVVDFFRYLNAIPNHLAFADTRKPMVNGTPEGLYLLKKLAGYQ